MNSYEENYNKGYREGRAIARMETIEIILEALVTDEFSLLKYKIRRLSEFEANLIYQEYLKHLKHKERMEIKFLYEII